MTIYLVDPADVPWRNGATEGLTFRCQVLLSGDDGGPEALRFRFDPTPSVYAHMHLTSQFQLVLAGGMNMPRGRLDLRALDVHYTDFNVPYGPFSTVEDHDMLVLHTKQGGLMPMAHADARRSINLKGRLITGSPTVVDWHAVPGAPGSRRKDLVPARFGPEVVLFECAPGTVLSVPSPGYGRYEVVVAGSAVFGERTIRPPGLRYVGAGDDAEPLVAGPDGATFALLSFDADSLDGGLVQPLGDRAADALAQAI